MTKQATKTLPEYDDLINVLQCGEDLFLPSALHGFLCGIICGSKFSKSGENFKMILNLLAEEGLIEDIESHQALVARLLTLAFRQLQCEDFNFQLLLPSDDLDLMKRSQALIKWCYYFLDGLGFSGITQEEIKNDMLIESLMDLSEIARADSDSVEPKGEQAEQSYLELVEYVRVAVMLIYTENVQRKMLNKHKH